MLKRNSQRNIASEFHSLLHDLLNPLTAISLGVDALRNDSSQNELVQNLHVSSSQLHQYIRLTREYINNDSSRIEFLIDDIVESVIKIMLPKLQVENINIAFENETIAMKHNPLLLYRALINILSNSMEAFRDIDRPEKIIIINVSCVGNTCTVSISDNGCGIEPTLLENIFLPYFSTKNLERNSGLGLSIAHDIIKDSFHGNIEAFSKVDYGTMFRMSFPIS